MEWPSVCPNNLRASHWTLPPKVHPTLSRGLSLLHVELAVPGAPVLRGWRLSHSGTLKPCTPPGRILHLNRSQCPCPGMVNWPNGDNMAAPPAPPLHLLRVCSSSVYEVDNKCELNWGVAFQSPHPSGPSKPEAQLHVGAGGISAGPFCYKLSCWAVFVPPAPNNDLETCYEL